MEYKELGATGAKLPEIGFGASNYRGGAGPGVPTIDRKDRHMRGRVIIAVMMFLLGPVPACAQLENIFKGSATGQPAGSDAKAASGLKEALRIGTENTVNLTGKTDGYFGNPKIKIPMPDKLRSVERAMRAVGMGARVDEFVLSLNRAAERAAPAAKQIFWGAITEMTFDDARKLLGGSDTAATEYFKAKTSDKLAAAFRPEIETAMNEAGATKKYKEMVGRYQSIPFVKNVTVDIDEYVVGKALDGLFYVLGEEEKKIRTNPVARVTDLLKEVFGR